MTRTFLTALLVTFAFLSTGLAGEYGVAGGDKIPLDEVPVLEDDFEFDFRIDGWIVQAKIELEQTALGLSKSVFIGFDDIISNLDVIVPLGADFRYKRVGFMPDFVMVKMSGGGTAPGPFFDKASYDLTLGVVGLPAYYRVIDKPNLTFDIIGGARYLWTDLDIGLKGGPLGSAVGSVSAGTDARIWDGFAGIRFEGDITDKLFYSFYGDVGTGDSDLTYQLLPSIGYRFTDRFSLGVGYRYLHYDLGDDDANVDLTASGVQLSLNWEF